MAFALDGLDLTRKSTGDTSSLQYAAMVISTGDFAGGVVATTDSNQMPHGIWQNNSTLSEWGKFRVAGVSKAMVISEDTAIIEGMHLKASTTTGYLQNSSGGVVNHRDVAIALGSVSTGTSAVIPVFLTGGGITSTST